VYFGATPGAKVVLPATAGTVIEGEHIVTMHVVLGDGEMTKKELTETLADIWKADEEAGQTFWFLLQGKSEPTDTDKNLVKWLEANDIYYELITDDESAVDEVYSESQETHVAKRLAPAVVKLLGEKPEPDEPAELLTLFVDNDSPDAEEDRWVNTVASAVYKADFAVRAMNDGLVDLDLSDEAAAEEAEPEEEKPKSVAKKAPTKKAAPASKDAESKSPGKPLDIKPPAHTREELEDMDIAALKAVAANLGISVPPRSRQNTYIDLILGEDKNTPAAEVDEPEEEEGESGATLNGFDKEGFADEVAHMIIVKVLHALKEAFIES
jgi:hypothetical protein